MKIYALSNDATVSFAASELARYLQRITDIPFVVDRTGEAEDSSFRLGTFEQLGLGPGEGPQVGNTDWDDAVYIRTSGASGAIGGSNPRSVLIAVYRYLTELGCRWVRPGAEGEYLPPVILQETAVSVSEAASYRHRALCIEGSVSYENVRDIIDWSVKLGFNSYLTQFRESYTFFERWYKHLKNPLKKAEEFPVERAREFKGRLAAQMKQRGIVFHDVGHGWTCEPLGMPGLGWDQAEAPPEAIQYLAQINGERKLWHGVPLNTNLCYSNPEVRRLIVDDIVGYSIQHPAVDVIHFWLADGSNNNCECPTCGTRRPADWYVQMLNELDQALTAQNLSTRIVFLIYVDLLWPPENLTIHNPDRFILMFAPITRTYSREFSAEEELPEPPPYERNKLEFPRDVERNLAFLKEWQEIFQGDSFDFDYHFMWDIFKDPGHYRLPYVLWKDIRNLRDIGLNGLMSCQVQRAFFPTGLGMSLMGQTLWDREADFDALAADYFESTFGPFGQACRDYLQRLSNLFDPPYIRVEKPAEDDEARHTYESIPAFIEEFRPVIKRNLDSPNACHARSWHYLDVHADMSILLSRALAARAAGDGAKARSEWEQLKRMAQEREDDLQMVLDLFWFIQVLEGLFPEPVREAAGNT